MKPYFPAKMFAFFLLLCSSRITATIIFARESATPQRLFSMVTSSESGISPTCISRNLLLKALESSLRPPYLKK
jgi:hypothetical protein